MVDSGAVHLAFRARLLSVSGIPAKEHRAFENKDFTPTPGKAYLEEAFVPQPGFLPGLSRGPQVAFGLYIVKWFGIAGSGITAIRTGVDAILAAFPAGFTFPPLASGDAIRVRGNVAPSSGAIEPLENGRAVCTITIPFRVQSIATAS